MNWEETLSLLPDESDDWNLEEKGEMAARGCEEPEKGEVTARDCEEPISAELCLNIVDGVNESDLRSLQDRPELKMLNVTTTLTPDHFRSLCSNFVCLCSLTDLTLWSCGVGVVFFSEKIGSLRSLSRLSLDDNNIEFGTGFSRFCSQLETLGQSLRHLSLNGNPLGNAGIAELSLQFAVLSSLENLMLEDTNFTFEGSLSLSSRMEHLEGLLSLEIGENAFGDDGLDLISSKLQHLGHLEHLDVIDCGYSYSALLRTLRTIATSTGIKTLIVSDFFETHPVFYPSEFDLYRQDARSALELFRRNPLYFESGVGDVCRARELIERRADVNCVDQVPGLAVCVPLGCYCCLRIWRT